MAQPTTITGSIGVFGGKLTPARPLRQGRLTKEILTRGQHADLFSDYRPWNDEERAKFRSLMVAFYQDFVTRAAEGRKKTYEEIDAVAQGRVWTGSEALSTWARRPPRRPRRGPRPGQGEGAHRQGPGGEPGRAARAQGLPGDDPRAPGGRRGSDDGAARGRAADRALDARAGRRATRWPVSPSICRSARRCHRHRTGHPPNHASACVRVSRRPSSRCRAAGGSAGSRLAARRGRSCRGPGGRPRPRCPSRPSP